MKTNKNSFIAMKIDSPLKKRIEEMARLERRPIADQAAYLIEKGFAAIEREAKAGCGLKGETA
jgi:hypothetical protein